MAILPTKQRDQILLVVAVAALGIAGYYYMNMWTPKRDELNESQTRLDSLLVVNQRAKAELAQGRTAELKAEAERLREDLVVMRQLVPTGNEVSALLDQVSTAARRVGLDIADVQPLPTINGDQYDAYKYRLSVRGRYHQIGVLLANIGSLQRIVAPINLSLTPRQLEPGVARSQKAQPLEALFEIQTYVARMALPTPTVVKGDPGAPSSKPGEK